VLTASDIHPITRLYRFSGVGAASLRRCHLATELQKHLKRVIAEMGVGARLIVGEVLTLLRPERGRRSAVCLWI